MGIISVLFPGPINYILIVLFLAYLLYTLLLERLFLEFFVRLGVLIIACLLGGVLALFSINSYEKKIFSYIDRDTTTFTGTLMSKEIKNNRLSLVVAGTETNGDILVYSDDLSLENELSIHSTLRVAGKLSLFSEARNPGEFDSKKYYMSRGILFSVFSTTVEKIKDPYIPLGEYFYQLKNKLTAIIKDNLEKEEAAILSSIVAGDKTDLTIELKDIFKSGGISHILCVSGMHISLLGSIILWLLNRLKINKHVALIFACILTTLYSMLCGMSISTTRALITFFIQALAFFLKRQYDRLGTLSVIMLFMLFFNPLLCYNSGFIFSFWSVFSFSIIAETSGKNRLYTALLLQMFSMPIVALYYYEIPVLSFAVNLLLLPYLGAVLILGLAGSFIGLILPSIATPILFPCHIILKAYVFVCEKIDALPMSNIITGYPSYIKLLVYFVILFFFIWLVKIKPKFSFPLITTGFISLILLLSFNLPRESFITFLDVGQGDGIFINDSAGTTYFIDGGSSSKNKIGYYTLEPFLKYNGIKEIDYWVVTHADNDHVNGLIELLENQFPIKNILISMNSPASDNLKSILSLSQKNNISVITAKTGDVLEPNPYGASLHVMWPNTSEITSDINASSLTFLFCDTDFTGIFTGDISSEEEKKIVSYINQYKTLNINLLKIAHHGSKYSSCDEFLSTLSPQTAVISCGINNRYNHPHEETLSRIAANSCELFRTDYCGAITVTYKNTGYTTHSFLQQNPPQ